MLWTRAALAGRGVIDDDVAYECLPSASRWLVSPENAKRLPDGLVEKLEWIGSRTTFLDASVDEFLAKSTETPQIVVVGAGYDTRAARYAGKADFFEIDRPDAVEAKRRVLETYRARSAEAAPVTHLALDLNELAGPGPGLTERLAAVGFDASKPSLFLFEAVLFYLAPPAVAALLDAALGAGDFRRGNQTSRRHRECNILTNSNQDGPSG